MSYRARDPCFFGSPHVLHVNLGRSWELGTGSEDLGTRFLGTPSTIVRTAYQFSRSWSSMVSMQVRPDLAAALSYMGKQPRRRSSRQPSWAVRRRSSGTTSGTTQSLARSVTRLRLRRPPGTQRRARISALPPYTPGSGKAGTRYPPTTARRFLARMVCATTNGFAPGSGGGAGSRGRRRPLVPRSRTNTGDHQPPLPPSRPAGRCHEAGRNPRTRANRTRQETSAASPRPISREPNWGTMLGTEHGARGQLLERSD
ncbi:hypothetical protein GA0115256_14478 [Streptomyces sp. DconLS]|nr:hypothetical protein GA0115256_14478 [Streptomyces sp. DconLS]